VGRIGSNVPFGIGTQKQPLVMPESGRLMLGVNDNNLSDNSGTFTVVVSGGQVGRSGRGGQSGHSGQNGQSRDRYPR
jgi:hypothetical protein